MRDGPKNTKEIKMEISKENAIQSFKVFNPDWKCHSFQFEIGKTYQHSGDVVACNSGFHACKKIADCFSYYAFDPANKIAAVLQWGKIDESESDKIASEYIEIAKEITWNEMLELANSGRGCSGHSNSGDWNSGNSNSGDRNSGNSNSGNSNSGDWNSGHSNSGDRNRGNRNSGYRNSGNSNSGDWNSGNSNSGDRNRGNSNSGNSNSGDRNSGNSNSGNSNSGDWNSGNWNSGDWNSGNSNSGDWNSGNSNSGYLNSTTPTTIRVFNKDCDRNLWEDADKPNCLYFDLTKWIDFDKMDSVEKRANPSAETCGGYLKTLSYKEAWAESFKKATLKDIELLKKLPNFDADVFFEISGIRL